MTIEVVNRCESRAANCPREGDVVRCCSEVVEPTIRHVEDWCMSRFARRRHEWEIARWCLVCRQRASWMCRSCSAKETRRRLLVLRSYGFASLLHLIDVHSDYASSSIDAGGLVSFELLRERLAGAHPASVISCCDRCFDDLERRARSDERRPPVVRTNETEESLR